MTKSEILKKMNKACNRPSPRIRLIDCVSKVWVGRVLLHLS